MAGNSDELNFIEKVRKSAKLGLNEAIKQISYNVVKTGEWEMLQNGIQNIFYCFVKCLLYCRTVRRISTTVIILVMSYLQVRL
uniref:DUF7754 domain-containing protein n=1 Tax=Meloidogyne enterolobii TaxID=390850 RepID=A0A6V7U7I7_MELEN|nr:unnamed protein product [Meloidogyne enterolobii]